jgi:aromatic-L-amino-acid/L-tryptophan decarboxylase
VPPLQLSPDEFRRLSERFCEVAADFLAGLDSRRTVSVSSAPDTTAAFDLPLPEHGIGDAILGDLELIAEHVRAPTGRRFPYVIGSGEPIGALGDFYASVLNQNVTAWRSAPAAVTIERTVIGWLAEAIDCEGFDGSFTNGGSLANLMALAVAREARAPANEDGAQPGIIYAPDEVHMSIPKAVGLLGIGRANLRLIPVDGNLRIDVDALAEAIDADRRAGRRGIALVASAGTIMSGGSTHSRSWLRSRASTTSGSTSTALTGRWRRSPSRRSSTAWRSPTRSRLTPTSGSTSRSTAASCSTATASSPGGRSPTAPST